MGGPGSSDSAQARNVVTDSTGNVIVTGTFESQADLGVGLVGTAPRSLFVAKYSTSGGYVWAKVFSNSTFNGTIRGGVVDSSGNIFVAGQFEGTINFGGSPLTSAGGSDVFLAKYAPDGTHVWSQRYGGTGYDGVQGVGVGIDGSNNVLITGLFSNTVDFGGGPLISAGSYDIFVAKYGPTGTNLWSKRIGTAGDDHDVWGVAGDSAGNAVIVGGFLNAVDFGGGALTSAGGLDIFMAKYGPTGTHLWSKRFGNTLGDSAKSVAIDATDSIILGGYIIQGVDFGGGVITGSLTKSNMVLAKFTSAGTYSWAKVFGNTAEGSQVNGVAVSSTAAVALVGNCAGLINFGGGALLGISNDICMARFSPTGAYLWQRRAAGFYLNNGFGVGYDTAGHVFFVGDFASSINLGGGALVNVGGPIPHDAFVVEYLP